MPTINVYYRESSYAPQLEEVTDPLKEYVAGQLTCSDITLDPGEVSVRPVYVALGKGMLADVELEVFAAPFPERVEKQDDICLNLRSFMLEHVEGLEDARAWLVLAELGHSVPPQPSVT